MQQPGHQRRHSSLLAPRSAMDSHIRCSRSRPTQGWIPIIRGWVLALRHSPNSMWRTISRTCRSAWLNCNPAIHSGRRVLVAYVLSDAESAQNEQHGTDGEHRAVYVRASRRIRRGCGVVGRLYTTRAISSERTDILCFAISVQSTCPGFPSSIPNCGSEYNSPRRA